MLVAIRSWPQFQRYTLTLTHSSLVVPAAAVCHNSNTILFIDDRPSTHTHTWMLALARLLADSALFSSIPLDLLLVLCFLLIFLCYNCNNANILPRVAERSIPLSVLISEQ